MDRILGWVRIAGRRGWELGGVAVGVYVVWILFQKLLLLWVTVFIGLLLAALLTPAADWLERRGLPRSAGAAVAVLGGVLVVLLVVTVVVVQFMGQMPRLVQEFQQVRDEVTRWLVEGPLDLSRQEITRSMEQVVDRVQSRWTEIAGRLLSVLAVVGAFLTSLVLAFFLVRDGRGMRDWALERLVSDHQHDVVSATVRRAVETLQGYVRATVLIGALDALLIGVALVVLGVPLAGPLAVLTFFGGFFPVVGATVAGAVAALVATFSGGILQGLIVVGVVVVVQQVDGNLLQPVVMGRAVDLHPVVILLTLMAGGLLAGIVGALMAVPVAAVLTAVGNESRERRDEQAVHARDADQTAVASR